MSEYCTQYILWEDSFRSVKEIREDFEKGDDEIKQEALQEVILMHMNGQARPELLMPIIQYVSSSPSKRLKKLLCYYWEMIKKKDKTGKLREEIILICETLRKDLTHANEYVRGATLRLLSKIPEGDILEPLVTSIIENLEDRFAYVRKNAIFTVYAIYRDKELMHLIPDAPELIVGLLKKESDVSCKRNAFLMLHDCAPQKASRYLKGIINEVSTSGHAFQLEILRLMKNLCESNPHEKPKYLRIISNLIHSKSNAVLYQCANTLVELSSSPAAIKRAAECYTKLLLNENDHNIRLIAFDRIIDLKNKYPKYVRSVVSDILRILKTADHDIKLKVLNNLSEMVCVANIEEVANTLKSELKKSKQKKVEAEKEEEYRRLVASVFGKVIHQCFEFYPEDKDGQIIQVSKIAGSVYTEIMKFVFPLLDYLGDACSIEIIKLTKEIVHNCPSLRPAILDKLYSNLCDINDDRVYRDTLWILSEYCETQEEILAIFDSIFSEIDGIMYKEEGDDDVDEETEGEGFDNKSDTISVASVGSAYTSNKAKIPAVNEDGTYVTLEADELDSSKNKEKEKSGDGSDVSTLVRLIKTRKRSFLLYLSIGSSLLKMIFKLERFEGVDEVILRENEVRVMMLVCSLVREGQELDIDPDTVSELDLLATYLLGAQDKEFKKLFVKEGKSAYNDLLVGEIKEQRSRDTELLQAKLKTIQADSVISISQLLSTHFDAFAAEDDYTEEKEVKGKSKILKKNKKKSSNLQQVVQLTGCNDHIYAEASITNRDYDIILDVLLVNQTKNVLEDISLEFATKGDLEVCEQPPRFSLQPAAQVNVKVNVKVTSTETGSIFGNIFYTQNMGGSSDGSPGNRNYIVLSDIVVNIMDYIFPATCTEDEFRDMWRGFEWENKITVRVHDTEFTIFDYLQEISKVTNMNCLTSEKELRKESPYSTDFLSANLYASSLFGEDALLNISIEELEKGTIEGVIRIRSKTQGIAKSLGKEIKQFQKQFKGKND